MERGILLTPKKGRLYDTLCSLDKISEHDEQKQPKYGKKSSAVIVRAVSGGSIETKAEQSHQGMRREAGDWLLFDRDRRCHGVGRKKAF